MKKKNKNKGFTIFELLVVFFVIGLISSILIVNWQKGEKQYQLERAAQRIAQDIRKTQDMALNIYKYRDPWFGWEAINFGVYFSTSDRDSYILFADPFDFHWRLMSTFDMETISIEGAVEIDSLYSDRGGFWGSGSRSRIYTTFSLPDGFTTLRDNGLFWNCVSTTIRIRQKGKSCPQYCKDIIIERTGRVSVQ